MLVSEDGEAANAGRAVGQLARRLGLSGGDLKALFLTGSISGARKPVDPTPDAVQEIATLRRSLRRMEHVVRNLQDERDQLVSEAGSIRVALYQSRTNRRLRWSIGALGVLVMAGVGSSVAYFDVGGPIRPPVRREVALSQPHAGAIAVVRSAHGTLYSEPDKTSAPLTFVPAGTQIPVKRLLWHMMSQWAEVDLNGMTGYVPTTEVEIH